MSKPRHVLFSLFLCLPVFAGPQQQAAPAAAARQSEPASLSAPEVQVLAMRPEPANGQTEGLIQLDVEVTDASRRPVSGLDRKDFTLLDNGRPEDILSFDARGENAAKPDPPVEVILVVDAVNQTSSEVAHVQEEVERFLLENGGHLAQPVSIYRFSEKGLSVTPQPSTDGNALAAEISPKGELHILWGDQQDERLNGRLLYRSQLYRSRSSLKALGSIVLEERRKPGRKLMVWLGGGWPVDASEISFEWITEFSTRLREARIVLSSATSWPYPARKVPHSELLEGVESDFDANPGDLALEVLATQSGGRVLGPDDDLAGMIGNCVRDASAYYTISFDPPRADHTDEYHELKVQIGKPGLEARTSRGYYDQPVYYDQPDLAPERVTVERLEQVLAPAPGDSDAWMTHRLSRLELSERMSSARLSQWKARLPGPESWAALVPMADASAFLDPPAAEIPATAPPDRAAQELMLSKTVKYLIKTIPKLPNFFATRTKVLYSEAPLKEGPAWKSKIVDRSLHLVRTSNATVLYRDGAEVVDPQPSQSRKPQAEDTHLTTKGTFGPILGMVVLDALAPGSELIWSRWEKGEGGPWAVFRYAVLEHNSHYQVSYCCLLDGDGTRQFERVVGYHGEIATDPESGAILRLTLEADLEPKLPVLRSAILVEYGPVEIGGKNYICPLKSVSLMRGRTVIAMNEWGEKFRIYGPFQTTLSDLSFADYHMFRSQMRILTGGDDVAPLENHGDSSSTGAQSTSPKKP